MRPHTCNHTFCAGTRLACLRRNLWIWNRKRGPRAQLKRLWSRITALDYARIEDVEVDGIDTRDYPDFCDAYIASATYKGREMTEIELARLNEDSDYVYEAVLEHLF